MVNEEEDLFHPKVVSSWVCLAFNSRSRSCRLDRRSGCIRPVRVFGNPSLIMIRRLKLQTETEESQFPLLHQARVGECLVLTFLILDPEN